MLRGFHDRNRIKEGNLKCLSTLKMEELQFVRYSEGLRALWQSLLHSVQTESAGNTVPYSMSSGGSFLGGKAAGE
jgi:hypothetical protein